MTETAEIPPYLQPFVLDPPACEVERDGRLDRYLPGGPGPAPAVLLVHGGPVPADLRPTPRDWPVFAGYGRALAARGVLAGTLDHRFHAPTQADLELAAGDIRAAVDALRTDARVDADRVALWFFSAGGLLSGDWLGPAPEWLRCVALTYPLLAPPPGAPVADRFSPVAMVTTGGTAPIVLTRVGRESPPIAATVAAFLDVAPADRVQVVDVPDGRHGFDQIDHEPWAASAVTTALGAVVGHLA